MNVTGMKCKHARKTMGGKKGENARGRLQKLDNRLKKKGNRKGRDGKATKIKAEKRGWGGGQEERVTQAANIF